MLAKASKGQVRVLRKSNNLTWSGTEEALSGTDSVAETAEQNHVHFATNTPVANVEMKKTRCVMSTRFKASATHREID